MNQHDLDILELGLHVKNEIWAENSSPAGTRLAVRRRMNGGKLTRITFAVDVDNTLLREHKVGEDSKVVLNHNVVALMRAIKELGVADIVVWSGGGADYAAMVVRKYGLGDLVWRTCSKDAPGFTPDMTLDDQECALGKVNLKLRGDVVPTPWMGI